MVYDRQGDAHYDTISAFIKSLRGSDPDAAIYYLAVMLKGGEDPKFIARRLIVAASEDVGNADPRALEVAVAAGRAVEFVGLPEAHHPGPGHDLHRAGAQVERGLPGDRRGAGDVRREGARRPPLALRSANYRGAKELGHGEGYQYPHANGGWVAQQYLPDQLSGRRYYVPIRGVEARLAARWEEIRREAAGEGEGDEETESR